MYKFQRMSIHKTNISKSSGCNTLKLKSDPPEQVDENRALHYHGKGKADDIGNQCDEAPVSIDCGSQNLDGAVGNWHVEEI